MTNNYILRRLRYTFDLNDSQMIALWAMADHAVTREQVSAWLKKDDDPACVNCSDRTLAIFLNGWINELRGKKDGPQIEPESRINNNIILRKIKIALNLRDDDICDILDLGGLPASKSELSAFFRKVGHRHYRELQDQMLRKFMQGLQAKHRPAQHQNKPAKKATKPSPTKASQHTSKHSEGPAAKTEQVNKHIWGKAD